MNIQAEQYSMLNDKQLAVVNELEKNILLIASAGTGKTNSLAYRIANIINKGKAKPEEIACLTFTNKACSEMKSRIVDVVGPAGAEVTIMTFHGFCHEIIRREAKNGDIGIAANSIIFDEEDCLELIRGLPEFSALDISGSRGLAVQRLIGLVKEYRGEYDCFGDDDAADYQQVIERLMAEKGRRVMDAAQIGRQANDDLVMELQQRGGSLLALYDSTLRQNHGLDFSDLINMAFYLLKEPERQARWQASYRYWCIDEVQDTSRLEYSVLEKLFGESNIIMCGDFFQTIYEWRGSQPDLIFDRFSQSRNPRLIVYNQNYRSTRTLLDSSYEYLKTRFPNMVGRFFQEDALAMVAEEGEKIHFRSFENVYFEASWIYSTLQQLKPKNLSRVCILARTNQNTKALSASLEKIMEKKRLQSDPMGSDPIVPLEFMLVDEFKFFRRREIKDVLAVFNMLANEWDDTSICRIAREYAKGIGARTIEKLQSEEAVALGIRPSDMLHPSTIKYDEPYEMLRRELEQGNVVVFDVESTGLDTARDEIIQIAAIRIDKHGTVLASMNRFLKATKSVGQSVHTHHITDEQLAREGIRPEEGLQEFLDFARDSVVVGHNVGYDLTILASQLNRLGMDSLKCLACYDTLDIFRRFYPQLKNHKLATIGEFCQVSHVSTHDAFDDISATGEILIYAVNNNIVQGIDERRRFFAKYSKVFVPFATKIGEYRRDTGTMRPQAMMNKIIRETGILERYTQEDKRNNTTGRSNSKVENLRQLYRFMRERDDQTMSCLDVIKSLLNLTSLSNTEFDLMLASHPKIPIITVHQAKGLEFDVVFFADLQEGNFPSSIAIRNNDFQEEARLFYVGITRARQKLYLSAVLPREKGTVYCRFINAIPQGNIERK